MSTPRPSPATQGAGSNYTKPGIEPPDHAIGRSRGGWTTKIHRVVDGNARALVTLLTPGQAGDSPMFEPLMARLQVPRQGGGRARTRPDRVRADKAYSSRAIRTHLRRRGIRAVIPEPADQAGHRKRRGSRGGRPPAFHAQDYRGRNVIERSFNQLKQWRGIATRFDKLATVYRAAILIHDAIT
ncbi:IS5 family transposase [Amycolatopsis thermoflava]|uniref:IS5 family transposase n=1 Tax=Amycolatopsis thermoflava TaxID=84480 RepID=UPI003D76062C